MKSPNLRMIKTFFKNTKKKLKLIYVFKVFLLFLNQLFSINNIFDVRISCVKQNKF